MSGGGNRERTVFNKRKVSCYYGFHSFTDAGVFDDEEEFEQFKHEMEKRKVAHRTGQFGDPVFARQFANYGMITGMQDRVIYGPKAAGFEDPTPNTVLYVHLHMMLYRTELDAAIDVQVTFGGKEEKEHPHNFIERFDDVRNQIVGEIKCLFMTLDFIYRANELNPTTPVALIITSPFLAKLFAKGPAAYWDTLLREEGQEMGTKLAKEVGDYVEQLEKRFWDRCNLCFVYMRPQYEALPKENVLGKPIKEGSRVISTDVNENKKKEWIL